MTKKRIFAIVAAAAVAIVVLGGAVSVFAATTPAVTQPVATAAATAPCGNLGLRLGSAMRDAGGRLLDVVAKLTGKSTDAIIAERQDGKTLAQIAQESGVDSSAVVNEALKIRKQILAEQVAAGTITQAQADAALAQMQTRLTERIETVNQNCTGLGAGSGAGGGYGRGMGRGTCNGACR